MTEALYAYLLQVGTREPPILARLREETGRMPAGGMQISADLGQFLGLLVELLGVRKHLEVGVFTGYSSLAVAMAMPPEGRITALDVSREYTDVARRFWAEAGVDDRIDLRLGDAKVSLAALIDAGAGDSYDMAFIDAHKPDYPAYYEACLQLVRPGGLIAIDNVLMNGSVLQGPNAGEMGRAIASFNRIPHGDERVSIAILSVGDGLTLCRRRP
jgi:caffeoyl-CoA O-methyltransferase